jgi:hypothetical protein
VKLYEIPSEFAAIDMALAESDGELSPELEQQFDAFVRASKEKMEAGAMVMRGLQLDADACRLEAKRLLDRAASLEKNVGRLKGLLLVALDSAFRGKLKCQLLTIWGQTSAPVTNFDLAPGVELTDLPDSFVRVTRALAKDALKEAFRRGEKLPEEIMVSEVPGTRFLRVK